MTKFLQNLSLEEIKEEVTEGHLYSYEEAETESEKENFLEDLIYSIKEKEKEIFMNEFLSGSHMGSVVKYMQDGGSDEITDNGDGTYTWFDDTYDADGLLAAAWDVNYDWGEIASVVCEDYENSTGSEWIDEFIEEVFELDEKLKKGEF